MECQTLDLREHVCPMALLLAKRAAAQLGQGDQLIILLGDAGAQQDIPRYFEQQTFIIEWLNRPQQARLKVTKE